jgi:hypothetical protein
MNVTAQIAKHLREAYFGVNWTSSNLKDNIRDVTWQQATTKVHSLNTIAALVYHVNYYIIAQTSVLRGQPLEAKDKYSFDHPPIQSQEDWEKLLETTFGNAEDLSALIEQLPETRLGEIFVKNEYGNYYRNLHGLIEHVYYHLGQIVLIKKILRQQNEV